MTINSLRIQSCRALVLSAAVALAACSSSSNANDAAQTGGGSGGSIVSSGGNTSLGGNTASVDAAATSPGDSASAKVDLAYGTVTDFAASTSYDSPSAVDGSARDASADMGGETGPVAPLPDFTRGYWVICNATDSSPGRIWNGTLTFTSETPTSDGAALQGMFHWMSNTGANGETLCRGSYVAATQQISVEEYTVASGSGIITGTDVMTYDPLTDHLVNGSWQPESGMWSAAFRMTQGDGGIICAGP